MEDLKALTECAECTWDYIDRLRMTLAAACKERDWKDKDGAKRRSTEVIADNVYFGDSKRSESGTQEAPAGEFQELPDEEKGELPF